MDKDIKIKVLCKTIPKQFIKKIGYCFYIVKCMYHIATSRVCIVEGYVIPVSILKHKKSLIIVQIWHALGAIKKFGKQILDKKEGSRQIVAKIMKMHNNYTFITAPSNATREFYSEGFGTKKEKILVLGMPRVDYLLNKDNLIEEKQKELIQQYPYLIDKKNILYVPTFRKNEKTNIDELINKIDKEKYNLIIRLHPLEEKQIEKSYTISRKFATLDLLKIADYVITDYSAASIEAAVLDKKTFFYLYDIDKYSQRRGLNVNLNQEMEGLCFDTIEPIIKMIDENKYPIYQLEKFKNKYVETLDTHNSLRIIQHIETLKQN